VKNPLVPVIFAIMLFVLLAGCVTRTADISESATIAERTMGVAAEQPERLPDCPMPPATAAVPVTTPDGESQPIESVAGSVAEPVEQTVTDARSELPPEKIEGVPVSEPVPQYDIPIVINDKVRFWIDYYSRKNHKSFQAGLNRSGLYLERFQEIFEEEGVPLDLIYMAHIESGYKTSAYSRAAAVGIFQFISGTARRYGLKIDYWVDERRDPDKSARAATAYLKKLYRDFDDWYLALAAYNGGEGRVSRALKKSGKTDFWGLAESSRYLRRETRNYVPAIIAAIIISKNLEEYGFDPPSEQPLAYETIEVVDGVDLQVLADCAGSDFDTLHRLNPGLRRDQTPPHATTAVHLPPGSGSGALVALAKIPVSERVLYVRHEVKRGDNLYDLARAYGVSVSAIQQTNKMGKRTMIRAGHELVIPTVAAGKYAGRAVASSVPRPMTGETVKYRVRKKDTLYAISRRYGTTPAAIASASGRSVNKVLSIGEVLTIESGVQSAGKRVHTVKRGDSLWRIAGRYKISIDHLCALNQITRSTVLYPGAELLVTRN
jgi:membrane-bound lytic murein transglycosylase D